MGKLNYDGICERLEIIPQPTLNIGGHYIVVSGFYEHFHYGCISIDINGEVN